ncbi:MAG: TetR/AcrR family transcriptional regulator [Aggregatilineales bacterium]
MSVINTASTNLNRAERRKLQTYEALKQATRELLLEVGYQALTIQAITDRADFGYGTFYLHFESKDDIVWTVVEEILETESAIVNEQMLNLPFPRREFVSWQIFFGNVRKQAESFIALYGSNGSAYLHQKMVDYLAKSHFRNLRDGVYSFGIDDAPPIDFMAQFAAGAMMRLSLWWLESDNTYTPEDMAGMIFTMYYRTAPPTK